MRAVVVQRWWRHLVAIQMSSLLQIVICNGEGSGLRREGLMKCVGGAITVGDRWWQVGRRREFGDDFWRRIIKLKG